MDYRDITLRSGHELEVNCKYYHDGCQVLDVKNNMLEKLLAVVDSHPVGVARWVAFEFGALYDRVRLGSFRG